MPRARELLWTGAFVSLLAGGCVRQSEHDALQARQQHTDSQLKRCVRDLQIRDANLAKQGQAVGVMLRHQATSASGARATLRDQLVKAQQTGTAQAALAETRRNRIEHLEALLDQRAEVLTMRAATLRAGGIILGQIKGQPPARRLKPHLRTTGPGSMEIDLSARLMLDKLRVDQAVLELKDGKVEALAFRLARSGAQAQEADLLRKLVGSLCAKPDPEVWHKGHPGPGTPQTDPFTGQPIPLVVTSTASCSGKAPPWGLTVNAVHTHDGADLDRLEVDIRLGAPID